MLGKLADLAAIAGMPSEPTLRKLIASDPDFAGIVKRGKNGDAYEIEIETAVRYVLSIEERKRDAERARLAGLAQLGLDLGLSAGPTEPGLTLADRKALLEEEVLAIKLARQRGELVPKGSVEAAIGQVLVWHQQQQLSFSARLAKRADVSRQLQIEIDAMVAADLAEFARRIGALGDIEATEDGDGSTIARAAVVDPAI
ncbi:hypothetical protein [Sphingomonas nostoxanthinifaciens]|uniref:hypothetical protein n=1 Tax=Sphingomonas nostoxanthinifaciens TaxID=2872652 RepID=UPI001CC2170F|nr:hypothetical protein [Sphingomonas nostoxanthinifaciens]UAK24358.1 hypothetical protein K8P63_18930 [Sphingomonas nostoxanthinifaciens]